MSDGVTFPRVGVGGVLVRDGRVLLIRRAQPPLAGRWVIPGGTVEAGESLSAALVREMEEETGLRVQPGELLTVFDRIERDGAQLRYHYVIVDYLCEYVGGTLRAGSDALEAAFVAPDEFGAYDLPQKAREVVHDALARTAARAASVTSSANLALSLHAPRRGASMQSEVGSTIQAAGTSRPGGGRR